MHEEYKTLKVDVSDNNTHASILVDILKQLEKVWWASYDETKEEWCTLLMCDREYPRFLIKSSGKFTPEYTARKIEKEKKRQHEYYVKVTKEKRKKKHETN